MRRAWTMIFACCCLAVLLRAQTGSAPDLHRAWLLELLDADSTAAASEYSAIAADPRARRGERLLATARLLELQRIGAADLTPVDLAALGPMPTPFADAVHRMPANRGGFDRLAERARTAAQSLATWLQDQPDRAAARLNPRPLVPLVYGQALDADLGGSGRESRRQLMAQLQAALRAGDRRSVIDAQRQLRLLQADGRDLRQLQRTRALRLLELELDGHRQEAARLRHQWFRDWRPAAIDDSPERSLGLVIQTLNQLRGSPDQVPGEGPLLARLAQQLGAMAGDPTAAMQFLDRLPVYRERLLRTGARDRGR